MGDSESDLRESILQRKPWLVLAAIFIISCAFNAVSFWVTYEHSDDWLTAIIVGVWIVEAMLFAAWSALGHGHFVTRMPLVLLCLIVSIVVPGLNKASFVDVERYEFVALIVADLAIYFATTGLLLAIRWFSGLRIENEQPQGKTSSRVQFPLRYLLILTTLVAIALAVLSNLSFANPRPQLFSFGPGFYISVVAYGGAYCFFALWPVTAMALVLLRPRWSTRAAWSLVGGWAIVTMILVVILAGMDEQWDWEALGVLLVQFGGAAFAVLAVLLARAGGYRLVSRTDVSTFPESVPNSSR